VTVDNSNDAKAPQQSPKPNPALRSLDRLVGTWEKSDPSGTVDGRIIFEWMEGGFLPRPAHRFPQRERHRDHRLR
jgi:hypothetical protein